ncbi:hypothetical protein Mapa_007032 [Marchantia paleacea]|nr:hypothetical protein Mapa_007032 [Marchantia paleacea]
MDSVKMLVGQVAGSGSASTEEPGFMEEVQGRMSLSRTHSTTLIIMPEKFAFTFTTANILLMGSTMFVIGPIRQLKMMFDPVRMCATICYLLSLFMALFCALKINRCTNDHEDKLLPLTTHSIRSLLLSKRQSLKQKSQADPMCLKCAELLQLHSFFLTVIAIILEAIAIAWYALSYIPFARSMAKTMLHSCFPRIF